MRDLKPRTALGPDRGGNETSWAVSVEGRSDPGGIVLLLEDRSEAESIAREIRGRGTMVEVRMYRGALNRR